MEDKGQSCFRPAGTEDSDDEFGLCLIDATSSFNLSSSPLTADTDSVICNKARICADPQAVTPQEHHQKLRSCQKVTPSVWQSIVKRDKQGSLLSLDDFRTAVCRGNFQEVKRFLTKGVPVDIALRAGWTALMYAASYGHVKIAEFLLQEGADANFNKASYMYTPLISAASSIQRKDRVTSCIAILLENDANPNVHERSHMTPLMFVCRNGNTDAVHKLLEHGAEVDRQDNRGWTALCHAADRGFIDVVKCLLNAKADTRKRCSEGTAWDIAFNCGYSRLAELIESSGGVPFEDSGRCSDESQAPLPPFVRSSQNQHAHFPSWNQKTNTSGQRCDDLDLFLCGLDLGHLVPCFQQQEVDFSVLLQMSEEDLKNIGVDKHGWRCKIMNAVHEIHKKKWEPGSVRPPGKTRLSQSESIALVNNITKHVAYIGSSITYMGSNWMSHHTLFDAQQDPTNLQRLASDTDEALAKTAQLFEELKKLQGQLKQAAKFEITLPADLIIEPEDTQRIGKPAVILAVAAVTTVLLISYRDSFIGRIMKIGK